MTPPQLNTISPSLLAVSTCSSNKENTDLLCKHKKESESSWMTAAAAAASDNSDPISAASSRARSSGGGGNNNKQRTLSQLQPLEVLNTVSHPVEAKRLPAASCWSASPASARNGHSVSSTSSPSSSKKRHSLSAKSSVNRARRSSEQDRCESDSPQSSEQHRLLPDPSHSSLLASAPPVSSWNAASADTAETRSSPSCRSDSSRSNSSSSSPTLIMQLQQRSRKRKETRKGYTCANCATANTPLWRKGYNGQDLCNKCGLYWSRHGSHRPLHQGESSPLSALSTSALNSSRAPSPLSSSSASSQFEADASPEPAPDPTFAACTPASSEEDVASSFADEDDASDLDYSPSAKRSRRSPSSSTITTTTTTTTTVAYTSTNSAPAQSTPHQSHRKNSLDANGSTSPTPAAVRSPSSAGKRQRARRNLMKSLLVQSDRPTQENSNIITSQQQQQQQYENDPFEKKQSGHRQPNSNQDAVECAQHAIQFLQQQQQQQQQRISPHLPQDHPYSRDSSWRIVEEPAEDLAAGKGISVDYQTLYSIFGHIKPPLSGMPPFGAKPMPPSSKAQPFVAGTPNPNMMFSPLFQSDPLLYLRLAQQQQQQQHQQQQLFQQFLSAQQQLSFAPLMQSQLQSSQPLSASAPRPTVARYPGLNSFTNPVIPPAAPLNFNLEAETANYDDDNLTPSSPSISEFLKFPDPLSLELNHSPLQTTNPPFDFTSPLCDPFETVSQSSDPSPSTPSGYLLCER